MINELGNFLASLHWYTLNAQAALAKIVIRSKMSNSFIDTMEVNVMKKILTVAPLIILLTFNSGCISISSRISPDPFCSDISEGVYRTFRCDMNQFGHLPEISEGSAFKASFLVMFGMIETPVGFVLDTLCLPYDLFKLNKNKKNQINKDETNTDNIQDSSVPISRTKIVK